MTQISIIYWRDIPAQVVAKVGRVTAKRELAARFAEAIDRAAMVSGAKDSDAYLAQWRRGNSAPCGADLEAEVSRLAAELERAYSDDRLKLLALAGGQDTPP
jgi:hypothetical protein